MKIQIINAKKEYVDFIAQAQVAMAQETENMDLDLATVKRGVMAVFSNPEKGQYYIATVEKLPIACLLTTYEWSDWRNKTVLWIQSVFVKPEYRCQGVYKKMYERIKAVVLENNYGGIRLYVDKTNEKATKVYHKLGMNSQHYSLCEWMPD
jgi:ribosomal protein S18 acetylase RimI-like enzyme